MKKADIDNYKKAGNISIEVKKFARQIIKPGMSLLDISEKIEGKIKELGGEIAFPVNLGINETAAHYTPSSDDETEAYGLLKIDIGIHIKGSIADTAFSMDLSEDGKYRKLIESSEKAVDDAIKKINKDTTLSQIGRSIQEAISSAGFSPIRNLSGHKLDLFTIHAGLTIPNYENNNNEKLKEGAYAIEPFATTGQGIVYDGGKSGIYKLENSGNVRDPNARKMLEYIKENFMTLPFCERWLNKEFKTRTRLSLMFLEKSNIISQYSQLVEKSHSPVAQSEHTIIIEKGKVEVITR